MASNPISKFLRQWASGKRRTKPAVATPRLNKARLRLEEFEERYVPASITTVPGVTVEEQRALRDWLAPFSSQMAGFQAQLAVDPTNPNKMVVVAATGATINGAFTLDGGSNWSRFTAGTSISDPLTGPGTGVNADNLTAHAYTNTDNPSIAFGRDGVVYVAYTASNATKTSGAVLTTSWDFSVADLVTPPTQIAGPVLLYRWVNQDPALNVTIGIDNTLDSPYTDPTGINGTTSVSSMVDPAAITNDSNGNPHAQGKAVYVAWNTSATIPVALSPSPNGWNPNVILVSASRDKGQNYTTPVIVSDGGYFAGRAAGAQAPQIFFSQDTNNGSSTDGITPGILTFAWNDVGVYNDTSGLPSGGALELDQSQPDGGDVATQVAASSTFTFPGGFIPEAITPPPPPPAPPTPPGVPPPPPVPPPPDFVQSLISRQVVDFTGTDLDAAANGGVSPNITDLDVTINIQHPHINQLRVTLMAPTGEAINLVRNGVLSENGHPATNVGLRDSDGLGVINSRTPTAFDAGTIFNDEAPRKIDRNFGVVETNNAQPYAAAYRPEAGGIPPGQNNAASSALWYPGYTNSTAPPFQPPLGGGPPTPTFTTFVGSLAGLYTGHTAAELSGTWTLIITDFQDDDGNAATVPSPGQTLDTWRLHFSAYIENNASGGFGGDFSPTDQILDQVGFDAVPVLASGTPNNTAPFILQGDQSYFTQRGNAAGPSPTLGLGPAYSFAYDRGVGAFDPHSGRLYVVYTAGGGTNTDVFLQYSDNNGSVPFEWSVPVRVNSDSLDDHFSEGNRHNFMPTVTVDPLTGSVIVMWYDARTDASNARASQWMSVSTDGGDTWNDQVSISMEKTAIDTISNTSVTLEPEPSNLANAGGFAGFGIRQGLAAYGGRITPVWAGNLNSGGSVIFTADVRTSAGPRVISSDFGTVNSPITLSGAASSGRNYVDPITKVPTSFTYNNSFAADGTREIEGFTVVFDRDVDVSTFTPADILVTFRGTDSPLTDPPSVLPIASVTPLDSVITYFGQADNATTFFVRFLTPQTTVGTYSYAIRPTVRDRMRNYTGTSLVEPIDPITGNPLPAPYTAPITVTYLPTSPPPPNVPVPPAFSSPPVTIPTNPNNSVSGAPGLPAPDIGATESDLVVPTFPIDPSTNRIANVAQVTVLINSLTHPRLSDLELDLVSPLGKTIVLAQTGSMHGSDMVNTRFTDLATTPIAQGTATYTGAFKPTTSLSVYNGAQDPRGTWALIVRDTVSGEIGVLRNWTIDIIPAISAQDIAISQDNDLNGDGDINDVVNGQLENVDFPIPDGLSNTPRADSPVNINNFPTDPSTNAQAQVANVTVTINDLDHTRLADLQIRLVAPDGTTVNLVNTGTLTGTDLTNTTFDDNAATPIGSGTAPYTGTFRPVGSFAGVIGTKAPRTITSISEAGTTVNVTTATAHGYTTGDFVQISGVPVAGYNGTYQVTVTGNNTFIYTATTSGLATAGGGTAAKLNNPVGTWQLLVTDLATGVTGVLNNWTLTVTPVNNLPAVTASQDTMPGGNNNIPIPDANDFQDLNVTPAPADGSYTVSTINVPALPTGMTTGGVIVDLNIDHNFDGDLTIALIHNGMLVTLVNQEGFSGDNFTNTRIDDYAFQGINNAITADAPFSGSWRGEPGTAITAPGHVGVLPMSQFNGMDPAGDWTLIIVDSFSQDVGVLKNWSLSILPAKVNTISNQALGNYIDQNANGRQLEYAAIFPTTNDTYSIPAPQGGVPFQGPYQNNTLPMSVTGPYVLRTSVLGQIATIASVTPTVGQRSVTVVFDRVVDPATFTGASVSRITQTLGGTSTDLPGTFTTTPIYPGATSAVVPGTPTTTFRIDGLTNPTVSGATYTVVTKGAVEAADNVAVNTGAAGIKITFNRDMDVTTFTPADVLSVVGPNGSVPLVDAQKRPLVQVTAVNPVNGAARQFTVTFIKYDTSGNVVADGQSTQGAYSLVLGSNIQSANQSQLVTSLKYGQTALNVTFDRDVVAGQPSPLDTLQVLGPFGPIAGAFTLTPVGTSTRTFTLHFPSPITTEGQYVFDFSSQITTLTPAQVSADGFNLTLNFTSKVLLTTSMFQAVLGPNGPIVGANGTSAPIAVTAVAPDGAGASTTWMLTFPDQIPTTPLQDKLKAGVYAITYKTPYHVSLGSVQATLATPANTLNIVLPQPVPSLNITSVYKVINNATGQAVLGPSSLAPTSIGGVPDTTGTKWTLSFPDQNPNTPTLDTLPAGTYTVVFTSSAKLDTNWNAGLDLLLGGSALTGQIKTISNSSASAPVPIVANGTVSMPLFVPQDVLIDQNLAQNPDKRIELLLNITHPNVTDLDLSLVAPDGTRIKLFTGSLIATPAPNATANFINTRLADETDPSRGTPIESGQPPFTPVPATKVYVPQFPLSQLVGSRSLGTWFLEVKNNGSQTGVGADGPIEIENWSLTLPYVESGNGLGETYADRYTAGFRVFTQDTTQQVSQFAWTPVGGSPTNDAVSKNTGRATAIAVDPSDPSGNTVFVGGATGGVWKTTNFLTQDAAGPTWVPLTDYSLRNGLNISAITVVPRNNDTSQSIVYALTGSPDGYLGDVTTTRVTPGVGLLRSFNGGLTWELLDSTQNVDASGAVYHFNDTTNPLHDHIFSGAYGVKIIADPKPNPTGLPGKDAILYMAISESPSTPAALVGVQGGIWRSTDGGDTWTRLTLLTGAGNVVTGQGTDVALAAGSVGSSGNLQYLYAAISGANGGVYYTSQAFGTSSLQIADGSVNPSLGVGNGNVQYFGLQTPVPVAVTGTPTGNRGRVVLGVPSLDPSNALANSFYQGWVYAFVANANGSMNGLYQTKDFGRNWTRIEIPVLQFVNAAGQRVYVDYGSNNEAQRPDHDIFAKNEAGAPDTGNMNISIAVDPQNPNIVYLGGLGAGNDISQPAGGLIRVDTTVVNNSQTLVFHDDSRGGVGPLTELNIANNGGMTSEGALLQILNTGLPGAAYYTDRRSNLTFETSDFINLYRDPNNPFKADSVLFLSFAADPPLVPDINPVPPHNPNGSFTNDGNNARWRPFTEFIQSGRLLDSGTGQPGGDDAVPEPLATGVHRLLSMVDPVTGRTRLIAVTDQGVYTGVDRGDGTMATSIGTLPIQNRSRNGNLQLGQYYSGAVQPTQQAADIAGALFYAMSQDNGFPVSSPNELRTGNSGYNGQLFDPFDISIVRDVTAPELRGGSGTQVAVDQTGTGTSYQYRQPAAMGNGAALITFFRVFSPPGTAADPTGPGQGSTQGLIRGNGADVPINNVGQWPIRDNEMGYFGVNPIDPNGLIMGSSQGRVYRSFTRGSQWDPIGPSQLVNAGMIRSAAFGAPPKVVGNNSTQVNNFIYVGSETGQVWVTFNAGGVWSNITGNLPGGSILKIIADPRRSSTATPFRDLYVVTPTGVFYLADSGAGAPLNWVDITGNLFTFTKGLFKSSDPLDQLTSMTALTSMAADWRFSIPIDPSNPTGAVRPQLYVSGDGGVFKLVDWNIGSGTPRWEFYPAASTYIDQFGNTVSVPDGGRLPDVNVTDIDISNGAIDPATGLPTPPQFDPNTGAVTGGGGLNLLLATTFGRGQFAIRLDSNSVPSPSFIKGPKVASVTVRTPPAGQPTTAVDVTFDQGVDPGTFTAADVQLLRPDGTSVPILGVTLISPNASNGSNPRNQYEITFAQPTVSGNYTLTIGYNPGGLGHVQAVNVPEIAGLGGEFMDQNDNTVNGEPGIAPTGDQYQTTVFLTVNPGPPTALQITPQRPGPYTVGRPTVFTVTVVDKDGNMVPTYNGSLNLTLSPNDPAATVSPTPLTIVNGVATVTVTFGTVDTYTMTFTSGAFTGTITDVVVVATVTGGSLPSDIAVGSDNGGDPNVNVYDNTGRLTYSVNPFPPGFNGQVDPFSVGFTGGNRTALGKRSDGSTFTVVGTGPTISNWLKVYDNSSGQEIFSFEPFEATFKGGIFVATGDVDGDGNDEIIITPDQTGGPRVTILSGINFNRVIANFFGINDPNFRGGARAAVGDINADGYGEVVVSAGFGGGPRISVYDGKLLSTGRLSHPIPDFFIFESTLRNGAYVAVGDVNGDGYGDIIGGGGPGGGPRVLALSGKDLLNKPIPKVTPVANFFAGNINNRGGIRVTAKNLDGDKFADIVVGDGEGAGSLVTGYRGVSLAAGGTAVVYSFDAYPGVNAGVFVG